MGGFARAVLDFPTVVFTFLLVVVIGYWLLVLVGVVDLDGDAEAGGSVNLLAGLGLGGLPATVVLSLLIAVAWFVSLVGTVLLDILLGLTGLVLVVLSVFVLVVALVCAWSVTRLLVIPLRHLFPSSAGPSRTAFVGRFCVIRTGRVTVDFGQAEVTAEDGSSAVVQVRQTGDESLGAGSTALIYDYDADGEFFWVTAIDAELRPGHSPHRPKEI